MSGTDPYEILSARYDAVMSHVDYPGWARLVERIWRKLDKSPDRILETGAGTCRLASHLAARGRKLVSTDISAPMLSRGLGRVAHRVCCDYRGLPFRDGSFDAVLCLYDAINYCLTSEDLEAFFSEAHRILVPGGVLVFDATTSRNSRQNFADVVFHDRIQGGDVVRHSWYDPDPRFQHNDFTYFLPRKGGGYDRLEEQHIQRVWPRRAFPVAAEKAGLAMAGCWDDDLRPAGPGALRLHMACLRP